MLSRLSLLETCTISILAIVSAEIFAQPYPAKPIRYIVPFPPGGGQDLVARALSVKLTETLGQPVIVDNRGGAGGIVGTEVAAKSPPDGYTILMGSSTTLSIIPNLDQKISYDPIRDFDAVTKIADLAVILVVHPSLPVRSVKELVVLAKARPGELNFGSSGNGTPPQLTALMFNQAAGIKMVHVPYRGSGPALIALLSGETQLMFGSMTATLPFVKRGQLRALAVTSIQRWPGASDVPTVSESGYKDFEVTSWYGIFVPAGTPSAVVTKLNAEIVRILNVPEFRRSLADQGAAVAGTSAEEFSNYVKSEIRKYGQVVKEASMRAD